MTVKWALGAVRWLSCVEVGFMSSQELRIRRFQRVVTALREWANWKGLTAARISPNQFEGLVLVKSREQNAIAPALGYLKFFKI